MFKLNRSHITPAEEEKFWSLVDIRADHECWLWQGKRTKERQGWAGPIAGYGWMRLSAVHVEMAYRIAFVLAKADIPEGLLVRHDCDNPPCCNPNHLRLGTFADNARDCIDRGRRPPDFLFGIRPFPKASEIGHYLAARDALVSGTSSEIVARDFDISLNIVNQMARYFGVAPKKASSRSRLAAIEADICMDYSAGMAYRDIQSKYDVCCTSVSRILDRNRVVRRRKAA